MFSVPGGGTNTKLVRNTISEPAEVELAPNWSERLVAFSNDVDNVEMFIQKQTLLKPKCCGFLCFVTYS